jgi:RNA polymerase sigma-70 factor (ECF subfamily)
VKEERRAFWGQKFREYRKTLNGYFRRRAVPLEDADDLAQEVYLRLLRVESTNDKTIINPEAYLYTVAVNLLRERAALRRKRENGAMLDEAYQGLEALADSPEVEFEKARRERHLAIIVEALPPKFRTAIILHYHHGMTYEQIAAKMGVTTHAVKKNISRGLQACRHKMMKP